MYKCIMCGRVMPPEKEKALIELKEKVADLSIGAAGRVVEKALSAEDHQRLIEDYIAQVGTASEN